MQKWVEFMTKVGAKDMPKKACHQSIPSPFAALPPPPTNLRVSNVTSESVRLAWSYDFDQESIQYYIIQYSQKDGVTQVGKHWKETLSSHNAKIQSFRLVARLIKFIIASCHLLGH